TATHIAHGRLVQSFYHLTSFGIEETHTEGFRTVLLNQEMFQTRTVRIDISQGMAVAMNHIFVTIQHATILVEHIAPFHKLIITVAIHITGTYLMKLGQSPCIFNGPIQM